MEISSENYIHIVDLAGAAAQNATILMGIIGSNRICSPAIPVKAVNFGFEESFIKAFGGLNA
jgi:hypothetical protein